MNQALTSWVDPHSSSGAPSALRLCLLHCLSLALFTAPAAHCLLAAHPPFVLLRFSFPQPPRQTQYSIAVGHLVSPRCLALPARSAFIQDFALSESSVAVDGPSRSSSPSSGSQVAIDQRALFRDQIVVEGVLSFEHQFCPTGCVFGQKEAGQRAVFRRPRTCQARPFSWLCPIFRR